MASNYRDHCHVLYYGKDLELKGLYLSTIDGYDLSDENDLNRLRLIPGDRYIVLYNDDAENESEQPAHIIKEKFSIHYGPRGENLWDYSKCDYLTNRDGIRFKFVYKKYEWINKWISEQEYDSILPNIEKIQKKLRGAELSSGISRKSGKPWYRLSFQRLKDSNDDIRNFCERPDYIKKPNEPKELRLARTRDEIRTNFEYFINKPEGTVFGLDYETHGGMPMESDNFEPCGVGIGCCDEDAVCCYFDIQWMIYQGNNGELELFKKLFNKYLDKFEDSVTYNNAFEQKVTYLLLKRLCLFEEAAAVNKCDGLVYKRLSLKYTVQRCLGNPSWDDHFDSLTDYVLPDLFEYDEETDKCKWTLDDEYDADGNLVMVSYDKEVGTDDNGNPIMETVTVGSNYHNNPTWKDICYEYPDLIDEFETLFRYPNHWGDPYACIPAQLHQQYCNRDAFYTGELKKYALKKYSNLCYYTYCNNLRLEALLHLNGCNIDVALRDRMELQCLWMIVYGQLNVVRWVVYEKLKWYKDLIVPEIPIVSKCMRMGYDPCDSKTILMDHLSETSDSGIDEGFFYDLFGKDLTDMIIEFINEYCLRLDTSFSRSRKVFNLINEKLTEYFNPDYGESNSYCAYTINGVSYRVDLSWDILTGYYGLQASQYTIDCLLSQFKFSEINKLLLPQMGDCNLPDNLLVPKDPIKWKSDGIPANEFVDQFYDDPDYLSYITDTYSLDDVIDYCKGVFNYDSANESPYLKLMAYHKFQWLVNYAVCTDYEKVPKDAIISKEDFDKVEQFENDPETFPLMVLVNTAPSLVDKDRKGFDETGGVTYPYHHDLMMALYESICAGKYCIKDSGEREKDRYGNEYPIMVLDDDTQVWWDSISAELKGWLDYIMRHVGYRLLSDEDYDWICHHMDEVDIMEETPAALTKLDMCFSMAKKYYKVLGTYLRGHFGEYYCKTSPYDENGVSSDQTGNGTVDKCFLPYFANTKKSKRWSSPWHTIPSKSEMKRIVVAPPGYLMSYFDISGCEIRTISYASGDEFMIHCYEQGLDPYITMARFTFPEDTYDEHKHGMDYESYLRSWRSVFKCVLLGCLYGMGAAKMAEMCDIEEELAEQCIRDLWARCPTLKKFVEEKSQWAMDHLGYVQSMLGDILEMGEDDGEDRASRLGINQFIQNGSSVTLADSFEGCIEASVHHNDPVIPNVTIRPLGVIHDSCQFYFTTTYLFRMKEYYTRHLTDHMYSIFGIRYEFDLEIGQNFYEVADMTQLDDHHIEFKGSYNTLKLLIDKCRSDGLKFRITSLKDAKTEEEISVNGFEFGPEFKPKLYSSIVKEFLDYELYAKFNEDKSKFKIIFEELPENEVYNLTPARLTKPKSWVAPF